MDPHYIRIIEHEQGRVASVLRDRESMARRKLSPGTLIIEHAPARVADNLIWDGEGWWIHMHLAPYGNGLLFQLVLGPDGRVVDLARPMAEQFPLLTWTSSVLVDLSEMASREQIAREVAEEITGAARRLVVEDARYRSQLEARTGGPPESLDKLIGLPPAVVPGHGTLVVFDFDVPLPRQGDFRVAQEVRGILYRSRPLLTTPLHESCLPRALEALGVDARRFCAALQPGDVATSDDAAPPRALTLRVGPGLVTEGALLGVGWIVRGSTVVPALARVLGDEARAQALAARLHALPRGRDEAGRSLHHVVAAAALEALPEAERLGAQRFGDVVAADPEVWFGISPAGGSRDRRGRARTRGA